MQERAHRNKLANVVEDGLTNRALLHDFTLKGIHDNDIATGIANKSLK